MKQSLAIGLGAAVLFAGVVAMAQDTKAPGAGGKAAAAPSMPMMAQMDEHMKKMQALHDRMMGAATPAERQKAMEAAHKEMQESTMMKPMMQGGGMMGGGMMGNKGKTGDAHAEMQMMGKRMDMMQMMMDQQGMMVPPKSGDEAPKK